MAMNNFPAEIKIKLGKSFVGGGNGLDEDQEIVIGKYVDGPNQINYSENGIDGVANTSPIGGNRIRLQYSAGENITLYLIVTTTLAFQPAFQFARNSGSTYTFLDLFSGSATGYVDVNTPIMPDSWNPTTGSASGSFNVNPYLKPNTFKTMEEYVPALAPDKTTYRYG